MRKRVPSATGTVKVVTWEDQVQKSGKRVNNGAGWPLLFCLVLYRGLNALLCRTMHAPDEHWQSLEVAYHMAFNRGHLTWEWHKGIRGYTHPLIFAMLYKTLALLGLDAPWLISESPRLLQSIFAAIGDWYLYKLALGIFSSQRVAQYTLLCQVVSWFTFYCSCRTLSNTFESSFTPLILYYWLKAVTSSSISYRNTSLYLLLAAVSVLIRPTGAVLWIPLVVYQLVSAMRQWNHRLYHILTLMVTIGFLVLCWSILVDRLFYGKWVIVQLEFLRFNILQDQSGIFGSYPWHWYFTQGLPVVLFTGIPFIIHGIWLTYKSQPTLIRTLPLLVAVLLVIVHSLIDHKEFRFILPVLPLTMPYAGLSVSDLFKKGKATVKWIVCVLLLTNIPMALYFSLVHQRGGFAVMEHLRQNVSSNSSVLFLMPCHSTALYSHLHGEHILKFLECPPERNQQNPEKEFYSSPVEWLTIHLEEENDLPTHLVFYDVLLSQIEEFVSRNSYIKAVEIFHAHYLDNDRTGNSILVYNRQHFQTL